MMFAHFKQHPPALRTFFGTEMWERYGFYVIQSLLALYLALHFHWSDTAVYTLVGAFTGLTYLSPIVGGWIADQWLGQKKTILTGACFLLLSYIALFCIQTDTYLKFALASIAVGTGFLKPNISCLLGQAYPEHAPERESGFTIFYMGITTGIILGTTIPSLLQRHIGWGATFASAAIGIILAIYTFSFGIKRYHITDYQTYPIHTQNQRLLYSTLTTIGLWVTCVGVLHHIVLGNIVFMIVLLASGYFIVHATRRESIQQTRQTYIIGLLCIISVIYWAFYFQIFLSLTLFITRLVQPHVWGIAIPAPYYVTVESIGMLIFGYFLSKKNIQFTPAQLAIRTSMKFFIAMVMISLAYVIVLLSIKTTYELQLISPIWLICAYLCIAISELLLSPVGLSIVSTLSSRKHVSTLTGIFFVSLSLGAYLAGKLAQFTIVDQTVQDITDLKMRYHQGFSLLFGMLCLAMLISYGIHRYIRFLMHSE